MSQVPAAHTSNPSYSGGRDKEDYSSKPAQQILHEILPQKKSLQNKRLVEWFKV
jgi:hypothetical protein